MFRFSMAENAELDVNKSQLDTANIVEEPRYADVLRDTGEYRDGERYFRSENESPASVEAAVDYVRGIFFHAPNRVWLEGEVHEVTAEDADESGAPHRVGRDVRPTPDVQSRGGRPSSPDVQPRHPGRR